MSQGPSSLKDTLRERQLARNRKACLPCRERKVRCNREHPCLTCHRRGHSDLCHYQNSSSSSPGPARIVANGGANYTKRQDTTSYGNGLSRPGLLQRPMDEEEVRTTSPLLGGTSIVAMARQSSQPLERHDRQTAFETGVLPLLGMGAENVPEIVENPSDGLRGSLPNDQDIIRLLEAYRHRVHPFHFITFDMARIEKQVCKLIMRPKNQAPPGDLRFLGLLHAILATGAQFSDLPLSHRISLARDHVKHAFVCLRTAEYLSKPTVQTLQTLLLLGNVLQNNMEPQAAWVLGGTTVRIALSLGIHKRASRQSSTSISSQEAAYLRLAILWQDSLLSLAFDRPPASYELDHEEDLPTLGSSGFTTDLTYRQAMNWLCHTTLPHLSTRNNVPEVTSLLQLFQNFELVELSLTPHLRDRTQCSSVQDLQEYHSFELHKNFVLSTLCRPFASERARSRLDAAADAATILERLQTSLKRSAWSFIRLRSITNHAKRSWAFVHNGLTSALLLSFMKETRNTSETRLIQTELIQSLERDQDSFTEPERGSVAHLAVAHEKALNALRKLRRLAEEDGHSERGGGQAGDETANGLGHPRAVHTTDEFPSQDAWNDAQPPGSWDMDEWLRTFDFDSFSPSEALNFIMPDNMMGSVDQQLPTMPS